LNPGRVYDPKNALKQKKEMGHAFIASSSVYVAVILRSSDYGNIKTVKEILKTPKCLLLADGLTR
jgi:hypothetical protein